MEPGRPGVLLGLRRLAALEAVYARIGIRAELSEQYLFHISKAHENHVGGPGIHSLVGFQGSADIVHHLTLLAVPSPEHVRYLDQPQLQSLANAIPGTGMALSRLRRRHTARRPTGSSSTCAISP